MREIHGMARMMPRPLVAGLLAGTDLTGNDTDGRVDIDERPGHGTGIATLIAGRSGDRGFQGVAPGAKTARGC